MKVEFTEDYSTRKKGDKKEVDDKFASFLIGKGVAKEARTRVTKEEKEGKKTKDVKD